MKATNSIMGMPISVEVFGDNVSLMILNEVFDYFREIDKRFSPYKKTSEISRINRSELPENAWSAQMKVVFALAEKTKRETEGYFDIVRPDGYRDPSGLVKGWAIWEAALALRERGFKDFYVEAGGDIQVFGNNSEGKGWRVGIRNPFFPNQVVKVLRLSDNDGIATSGTYARGQHIYNPHDRGKKITDIVSLTVIGPNVYDADRFATAAFAMGNDGILFIESIPELEAYMVDKNGVATMTNGFARFVAE